MHVAVTAIGADRPGIIAAVTQALFDAGANIEDSRMATLGGHFAMMLIVAVDSGAVPALEERLSGPADALDLTVAVRPVGEVAPGEADGEPYVVSVYGADHPGIVARVTGLLAERGVNINDLATHVIESDEPVYVMVMEASIPPSLDPGALGAELTTLAGELSVDVSMHPMEPDTL